MAVKIRLPYDVIKPEEYKQNYQENKYILLNENDTFLTFDGKRDIQDDLNLDRDVNSIYSVIDKFQNDKKTFSNMEEAYEFMKRIGKEPKNILDAESIDISGAPKSLAELAKLGQNLKNVMEQYNDQISNMNNIQNQNNTRQNQNQNTGKQETKQETEQKEVGGK